MSEAVRVKTDKAGYFASIDYERVLIEFSKNGDSPQCPNSWTWDMWLDGEHIDGTCDEASLHTSVMDTIKSIDGIINELKTMNDWLKTYEVFGKEPEVDA